MFAYEHLVYTPAFYFLIAFTLLLTFGYSLGRRWNRRIVTSALDPLLAIFKAKDQQFTNIGGQTGFHANIVPGNMKGIRRVDVTLTILPRQSLLYMPFSLLIRKFDRLQMLLFFSKPGKVIREEAHLIERRFEKMAGNRIENVNSLNREDISWSGMTFHLYSASQVSRKWMENLKNRLGEAGTVRHVALVPSEERAYLFMIPRAGTVAPVVTHLRDWLEETVHAASDRSADEASASPQ